MKTKAGVNSLTVVVVAVACAGRPRRWATLTSTRYLPVSGSFKTQLIRIYESPESPESVKVYNLEPRYLQSLPNIVMVITMTIYCTY